MIDTHCHLNEPFLRDRIEDVIAGAALAGVTGFVVPSVDLKGASTALALSTEQPRVHPAAGIHPMMADFPDEQTCRKAIDSLASILTDAPGSFVAIGEIGLDDQPGPDGRLNQSMRELAFQLQLELARELRLPVILHVRGTMSRFIDLLERIGPVPAGGVAHAFPGSVDTMARLLGLGYLRGVAGTVTRPGATRLVAIIARTSPAHMLLETDAPFLANAAHGRGRVVPADLALTAGVVAGLTGTERNELIRITDENARRIFGIVEA